MRLVITSEHSLDELWDYCVGSATSGCFMRLYTDGISEPWAWQLVVDASPALDLLLIKYSESITVYRV